MSNSKNILAGKNRDVAESLFNDSHQKIALFYCLDCFGEIWLERFYPQVKK